MNGNFTIPETLPGNSFNEWQNKPPKTFFSSQIRDKNRAAGTKNVPMKSGAFYISHHSHYECCLI